MSIEFYQDLLLVQSLEYSMKEHLSVIEEQVKRLQFIEKQIESRREEKDHAERSLTQLQSNLQSIDSEHQKTMLRCERLKADGASADAKQLPTIEREFQSAKAHAEALEASLYEIMNREEEAVIHLRDLNKFLDGAARSRQQLSEESEATKRKAQSDIDQLQTRIDNLLSIVPGNFKQAYLQANQKHRFRSPLSYLEKEYCQTCRFRQDRTTAQEVEEGRTIHHCQGCGRLLIPLNAKS